MAVEDPLQMETVSQVNSNQANGVAINGGGEANGKPFQGATAPPTIIDIRKDRAEHSILQDIKAGLRPEAGQPKTLPTLLLYDVDGLRLFEQITYLNEYYLTNTEIEVLEKYASAIAKRIESNSMLVELGSGYDSPFHSVRLIT